MKNIFKRKPKMTDADYEATDSEMVKHLLDVCEKQIIKTLDMNRKLMTKVILKTATNAEFDELKKAIELEKLYMNELRNSFRKL